MKKLFIIPTFILCLFSTSAFGLEGPSLLQKGIEALKAELTRPGFSGAVQLVENGEVKLAEIQGFANKETGHMNSIDTKFNIASVGKFLTSLAVFQLASEKGYDIKTKQVQDLFPDKSQLFETALTFSDLLIHRTDVKSILGAENAETIMAEAQNNHDIFNLVLAANPDKIKKLRGELRYANSNYFILGEVIERLSGQSYESYMIEKVLTPLGAPNATFAKANQADEMNLAIGYVTENFNPEGDHRPYQIGDPLPSDYPNKPMDDALSNMVSSAGGGLYISASEFANIGLNLYNSNGVPFETLQAMCTTTIPVPRVIFGYGCNGMEHTPEFIKWGASGGAPGVNAELAFYPEQKAVLILLSNHDGRATPLLKAFEAPLTPASSGQFIIK